MANAIDFTGARCPKCKELVERTAYTDSRGRRRWCPRCKHSFRTARADLGTVKPKVESRRVILRVLRGGASVGPNEGRPKTRGECVGGPRPCPWVTCRYHLYLDVTPAGGIKYNFPDRDPDELEETCALDVAERGGCSLDSVAAHMNLISERVRQIEERALKKLHGVAGDLEE